VWGFLRDGGPIVCAVIMKFVIDILYDYWIGLLLQGHGIIVNKVD
jgi:hypothetical protein